MKLSEAKALRAAVDLWDTAEDAPDETPALWEVKG